MAMSINTNVVSINAQRNLALSGGSLATSMQRLSSGLRVNSAKDDAAGLAIAERMSTQVRGLAVASRNANDGISLAQTAEGALSKVGDMLQRMRELAVQAGNATNSKGDREALQLEVKQLADEVDRVAKQTNFNGQKVLDGSFAGAVFQVGANSGDNITLGALVDTRAEKISSISYASSAQTGIDTAGTASIASYMDAISAGSLTVTLTPGGTTNLPALPAASSPQERLGQVIEAINNKSADTGVVAYLTKQEGSEMYTVEIMSGKTDTNGDPVQVTFAGFSASATGILNATGTIGGSTAGTAGAEIDARGINDIDVGTQAGAWIGLKKIDSAIDQVNSARATLGAIQTRFETAVNNIDIQVENLAAARGRIIDADFAVETANLSRTQILQQAGTAMVAQANQIPQNVLQLLQG